MSEQKKNADDIDDSNGNTEPADLDTSFDLDEDVKPEPLLRKGWYKGRVAEVALNLEGANIDWTVTLSDNGGVMSDGETEIDGQTFHFRNWLPKESDKTAQTKGGKNKWQNKINMLEDFAKGMEISMKNVKVIQENIANGDWLGIPVLLKLEPEEYQGRVSMRGQQMKRREEED